MLWKNFNTVIILIQQIRQIDDSKLNVRLQRACAGFPIHADITNLNSKVAANFSLHDLLENTVIIQKNKPRHMINRCKLNNLPAKLFVILLYFQYNIFIVEKIEAILSSTAMLSRFKIENMALLAQVYYTIVRRCMSLSWQMFVLHWRL